MPAALNYHLCNFAKLYLTLSNKSIQHYEQDMAKTKSPSTSSRPQTTTTHKPSKQQSQAKSAKHSKDVSIKRSAGPSGSSNK